MKSSWAKWQTIRASESWSGSDRASARLDEQAAGPKSASDDGRDPVGHTESPAEGF